MNALAPAMGKAAWPHRCLAPQLGPSRTSSERTFGQCVSPSPTATAAIGPCTHRKSREVIIHLHWEEKASELGRTISGARHRRLGERARLGAPRVGRVRMVTAATGPCTLASRSKSTIPPPTGKKNERAWKDHRASRIGTASTIVEKGSAQEADRPSAN